LQSSISTLPRRLSDRARNRGQILHSSIPFSGLLDCKI